MRVLCTKSGGLIGKEKSVSFDSDALNPPQQLAIQAILKGNRIDEQACDMQTYCFVFYESDGAKAITVDESMITDEIAPIIQAIDEQMK